MDEARKVKSEELTLHDKLRLSGLIGEGLESELFKDLWPLMAATISGSKFMGRKPEGNGVQFHAVEINAANGENLGWLNMLYFSKPRPCYYLVYLETHSPFRRNGLGNRILAYFGDFLIQKSALGILDNIIPKDDPTCDIYLKQGWEPVENVVGNCSPESNGYMIFIPSKFRGEDLKQPVLKLLNHLQRKRVVIDMKTNELGVKRTIEEFKRIYSALVDYFKDDFANGKSSALMRFMFTRFVTKLVAFRRDISNLLGYTGGESLEQIVLLPEVANLKVKSYQPPELAKQNAQFIGELRLLEQLPEELKNQPARCIEALPNYRRPSYLAWLREKGKIKGDVLRLGDLMELGFDPTRLKEITIGGEVFIFERIQARRVEEIIKKKKTLEEIAGKLPEARPGGTELKVNPPLLIIGDGGNAYVLRRKIKGVHYEEALEQLRTNPHLKDLNISAKLNRLISKVKEIISGELPEVDSDFVYFVSWEIEINQPGLVVDSAEMFFEKVWLA